MITAYVPDVVRAFERSYSRLADQATELLFSGATWFSRGSWMQIGLKVAVIVVVLGAIHFALGGVTAMGDKRPAGPKIMWASIAVASAVVAFVFFINS